MRSFRIFGFFLFFSLSCTTIYSDENSFTTTALTTFDEVWELVRQKHYDKKMIKTDWKLIRSEFLPKVKQCGDPIALCAVLNEMVGRLGHSHVRVLPPRSRKIKKALAMAKNARTNVIRNRKAKKNIGRASQTSKPGGLGLNLCLADDKVTVLRVAENSPANQAGIHQGDLILAVNGLKIGGESTKTPWDIITESMLIGYSGTEVELKISNMSQGERKLTLKRGPMGTQWFKMGYLPKIPLFFESKMLQGKIAYVFFSICFHPQIPLFRSAMNEMSDAKGLIIDLRNNPGGWILFPNSLAGWLSDKEIYFGEMKTKDTTLNLRSYPQANAFAGPIVILINRGTASSSEVFAAGMRDNDRAILVGETTSGECLPSQFLGLSTGFRLQTVIGDLIRKNGERIEGVGVKPDFEVKNSLKSLSEGRDEVLEKARSLLIEKSKSSNPQ